MMIRALAGQRSRGFVLVLVLLFLLVMTIAGVSLVEDGVVQERMAGNTRQRDIAFEAAEYALEDAQQALPGLVNQAFDGADGLLAYDDDRANDADYWRETTHWGSYRSPAEPLTGVAEQPRYVVEYMPGYASDIDYRYYRVTARGIGGDKDAVVVLQAMFKLPQ